MNFQDEHVNPVLSLVNPVQQLTLEVETQRKLDLPVRTESNRALNCLSQQSKRSTSLRLRETTARLEVGRSDNPRRTDGRQGVVQCRRRKREVREVEDVENLCSELEVRRFRDREALIEHEVKLLKAWTTQSVAR